MTAPESDPSPASGPAAKRGAGMLEAARQIRLPGGIRPVPGAIGIAAVVLTYYVLPLHPERDLAARIAAGEIGKPAEADFAACLDTAGHPDPDLVIRTSGETRTSNFLPWQAAYSEYEFTPVLWPDFTAAHLAEILDRTSLRQRRFGAA